MDKEKAFQQKVKRFDRKLIEILVNIVVSALVTIWTMKKLGAI